MTCRSSTPSSSLLTLGFSGHPLHIGKCTKSLFYAPGSPLAQRYCSRTSAPLSFVVQMFTCWFRQQEERVLGEERAAELSRLTGMFILRRTQEIINRYLPPRLDWTLFCAPSPLQLELYKHLLCHRVFRSCLQATTQTHTHLACITALKKLCNHPVLLYSTVQVQKRFIRQSSRSLTGWATSYGGFFCLFFHRKEQIMDQKKAHSMKGWQSSSQNPTLQVNSLLRTLENSWFSQTCWAPSDDSAHQTGAYVSDSSFDIRDCWTKATT